ncbi:MAG: DUF2291 family protein [Marinilabiliales bacterium]|nr:MAG: DUF2291 family protein [Marinilabiliales bacterium]
MSKKAVNYIAGSLLVVVVIVLSIDIHSLDRERRRPVSEAFDVEEYVGHLWENLMPERLAEAADLSYLLELLGEDPDEAFDNYSHKLGISNTYYFYVSGSGVVEGIGEETVTVTVNETITTELETTFVFGNAVRDGSGLVDIDEFLNMMDFNMVSVYLNRKVKSEVIEPFMEELEPGTRIRFTGAAEINRLQDLPDPLRLIPIQISVSDGE